jgi:oligopeptide/dipeptide ABC transporter ATP-binding protein
MSQALLSIENLSVRFKTYAGTIHAVNSMSFDVRPGEIFGLVGESGCGKSVTGLAVVRTLPGSGRISGGRILFHGEDLAAKSEAEMQAIRGRRIAMVFQDPTASLNPVFTIGQKIHHIIPHHTGDDHETARRKALEWFNAVALPDPQAVYDTYPHRLSGGMQQRVMIAMALCSGAELLIADEPTTALDVTIQAQILELLVKLRDQQGISILLITHNLGVVAETCERVAVAYAGQIVETGPTSAVLARRLHPYTEGLLAALPTAVQKGQTLQPIAGQVPDGLQPIAGCPFHPRCNKALPVCAQVNPALLPVEHADHLTACHLYTEAAA